MRADYLLLGYCDLRVNGDHATRFLNLCRERGYVYQPLGVCKAAGEGTCGRDMICRCRRHTAKVVETACQERGIEVYVERIGGLPSFLCRFRKRAGLAFGILLAAVLIWLASSVVWDVRIEGEGTLSVPQLREELAACGLSVGSWIPTLETDDVESRLLTSSRGVAWVSVNMRGTVAYVQIRQLQSPKDVDGQGEGDAVNLVASCDGVVEFVRLLAGEVVVEVGELVRAGQLLISGVRDHGDQSYDVLQAKGQVFARTEHTITIQVPLISEQKVYTGQKSVQKTLFFFGKAIKITKSTGIMEGNCDTIKRLEIFSLFGSTPLPISMETVESRAYQMQSVTLTAKEASELAYEQLAQALALVTRDATLLSQRVTCQVTEQECLLTCTYRCVENIAVPLAFFADHDAQDAPK